MSDSKCVNVQGAKVRKCVITKCVLHLCTLRKCESYLLARARVDVFGTTLYTNSCFMRFHVTTFRPTATVYVLSISSHWHTTPAQCTRKALSVDSTRVRLVLLCAIKYHPHPRGCGSYEQLHKSVDVYYSDRKNLDLSKIVDISLESHCVLSQVFTGWA